MVISLLSFAGTMGITFYGSDQPTHEIGVVRTAGCLLLGIFVGMFIFVLP
jgi:hypothetical protein